LITQIILCGLPKRGNLSISDFVDKVNSIADDLALASKLVDEDDLILLILNDVGLFIEATMNSIQAHETPLSLDDVVGLLLSAELQQQELSTNPPESIAFALYIDRSRPNHGRGGHPHFKS
jgi:hypothetical protein